LRETKFAGYLAAMLRTYMPCLPTRVPQAPTGERWIHEVKHDGYRFIARKIDGRVRLPSKQGYDWPKKYPLVVDAGLPADNQPV
jgi:bifunctional non-homologous end joining protein LigD